MQMQRVFALVAVAAVALSACTSGSTPEIATDAGTDATPEAASVVDAGATVPSVDKSKLTADECSETIECPPGLYCAKYSGVSNGDPELRRPRCGPINPCEIVTCPARQTCSKTDFYPGEVRCF